MVEKQLGAGVVYCFSRDADRWTELDDRPADELARFLDYNQPAAAGAPREMQVLCAPLRDRDGVLGLLKVSSRHAGALGTYEAALLAAFLPQATLALQNAQRTEILEAKVLAAERKHAMAELARGVSHDLNNALGSVLPIVQQMCAEAEGDAGIPDAKVLAEDLRHIERSLHVCRRIFHGMLSFSRRSAATIGNANVRHGIDGALAILEEGLRRRGVTIERQVAESIPSVQCAQSDLEQLLLNLLSNSRDAMPEGGRLLIQAEPQRDKFVRLTVQDSGVGIAPEHLPRVQEPFFSTKPSGSGLGLSICRSIVWDMRGRIEIDSTVGRGTSVTVLLPIVPG
jgi:signal transduction histidine kinase